MVTAIADNALDTPRIEFLDRLTPRQAVLLHYFWSLGADALTGDFRMFQARLAWLDRYATEMRQTTDGQRQIDLMTARISSLPYQLSQAEMAALGIYSDDAVDSETKCIKCGCSDQRACDGGCSWVSMDPPICSRCA